MNYFPLLIRDWLRENSRYREIRGITSVLNGGE